MVWLIAIIVTCSFSYCEGFDVRNDASEPPWRRDVILWQAQIPNQADWRDHPGLTSRFLEEYPDDLEVLFLHPAGPQDERMWVRVIAYDDQTHLYLGVLLNSPDIVQTISQGDNVSFRVEDRSEYPLAVSFQGDYRKAGLPDMAPPGFFAKFAQGARWYRLGNYGHNPAALDSSVTAFGEATLAVSGETGDLERFYLHFLMARCYAEQYQTLGAIEQFEQAIAIRPEDEDAQMGLLAELSLLAHSPESMLPVGTSAEWEQRFVAQVEVVRSQFPPEAECVAFIEKLLSGALQEEFGIPQKGSGLPPDKSARIGDGTFRWKHK